MTVPLDAATNVLVSVNCNAITNATSYTFELNTNATFPAVSASTKTAATYWVAYTLSYKTKYYVRVKTNLSATWGVTKSFTTRLAPGGRIVATEFTPTAQAEVYPNPFADEIWVLIECAKETTLQLTLTDMQGKVLYKSHLHITNQVTRLGSGLSNRVYYTNSGFKTLAFRRRL